MRFNLIHLILLSGSFGYNYPQNVDNNNNIKALAVTTNNNNTPPANNTNTNNNNASSNNNQSKTNPNSPKPTSGAPIPTYTRAADHDYKYYNIKNIAESIRVETCVNQQSFCDNVCGFLKSSAMINECSSENLKWKCECENNLFPSPDNYTFPAEFVICQEDLRSCELGCSSEVGCQMRCRERRICVSKDVNDGKVALPPTSAKSKTYDIFNQSSRYSTQFILIIFLISLHLI